MITRCTFSVYDKTKYNYGYAISLSGKGSYISITECYFNGSAYGVELVGFDNTIISNNKFVYNLGQYHIIASNVRRMYNTIISNNIFSGRNIFLTNCEQFNMSDNICMNMNGITLTNCKYGLVKNNNCTYHADAAHYGIMIEQSQYNRIESNNFDLHNLTAHWSSMRCYGESCKFNIFTGNYIYKPSQGEYMDQIEGA